ncbi:hypothetical protein Efla_005358 [Eimeria flavescens]
MAEEALCQVGFPFQILGIAAKEDGPPVNFSCGHEKAEEKPLQAASGGAMRAPWRACLVSVLQAAVVCELIGFSWSVCAASCALKESLSRARLAVFASQQQLSTASCTDRSLPASASTAALAPSCLQREAASAAFLFAAAPSALPRWPLHLRGPWGLAKVQMSEKRYKEQLTGKKFRTVGRSSIARHYRIQGRGGGLPRLRKATGLPANPIVLPMRRCMLLGKMDNRKARSISHSGRRTHRIQRVNLAWKRLWWPEGGRYVRLRLSMKGLKTIKKYGLQRAADKFKLNLNDKRLFAGWSHRRKGRRLLEEMKATANASGQEAMAEGQQLHAARSSPRPPAQGYL